MSCYAGKKSEEMLDYLLSRRSLVTKKGQLVEPGPNKNELDKILTAAARVPDHGKLSPFYFLVFEGDARAKAGNIIADIYSRNNPDQRDDKIEGERGRFMRAPCVIGVVYRARQGKHPLWEQIMSAGAACQNLILAANASGFGAQWLTEWYAYDNEVRGAFGLDGRDVMAGFIYIGTPAAEAEERERPDLSAIVNHWEEGAALNKGDIYNMDKYDIPPLGFEIKK